MTRSNSQRAGAGMSGSGTQAAAQEPTISAWDTNQNSWEEDPRDRRDELQLYMADKSIQVRWEQLRPQQCWCTLGPSHHS